MSYELFWWISMTWIVALHLYHHGKRTDEKYNVIVRLTMVAFTWWVLKHFGVWDANLYWRW